MENRNSNKNILIIDDEPPIRNLIAEFLKDNFACITADSAEEALKILRSSDINLVLTDINLGGMTGTEMIPHVHAASPDTVVMMISGEGSMEGAINAMRLGAFDYISKPLDLDHIEVAVERALEHHSLLVEKRKHETRLEELVKQRTEELIYLSYHDALTNLPNSILFEDRLSQAIAHANRFKQSLAMLYISIDRFDHVNDTLGHRLGSELMKKVADRLSRSVAEDLTIARFEGSEFALLIPQITGTEDIIAVANDIYSALEAPFVVDSKEIFLSFSVGISLYPDDATDGQKLLKNASAALAGAKEQGGNNYRFYRSGMNERALKRLILENSLRKAIEREEFEVHYQPKLNVKTDKIVGVEALVRWRNQDLGLVSPKDFIPLAEMTGLIIPLGEWVLRTACKQLRAWNNKGFSPGVMSVNLSARQFQRECLLEEIESIVAETGIDASKLELELTESYLMKDPQRSIATLHSLKKLGIKLSIDDFGTEYSSLSYLKRLPIDILKIDQSFVQDLTENPDDIELVQAITTLAHNLRLKVLAEGVENAEQLQFLKDIDCDEWQGYYFSRPVTSDVFESSFLRTAASTV